MEMGGQTESETERDGEMGREREGEGQRGWKGEGWDRIAHTRQGICINGGGGSLNNDVGDVYICM